MKMILLCLLTILISCGPRIDEELEGIDGRAGKDGSYCTIEDTVQGADITCSDGTSATLYDGADGQGCSVQNAVGGALITCGDESVIVYDGENFATSDQVTEFIDPCGDHPGHLDEILMVTYGGDVVAYYEQGGKRFLAVLEPGSYITTDKQKCHFTISNSNEISF